MIILINILWSIMSCMIVAHFFLFFHAEAYSHRPLRIIEVESIDGVFQYFIQQRDYLGVWHYCYIKPGSGFQRIHFNSYDDALKWIAEYRLEFPKAKRKRIIKVN